MNKPDFQMQITATDRSETLDDQATKLALALSLDWDATRVGLERSVAIFSKLGNSTNAHHTGLNRWI